MPGPAGRLVERAAPGRWQFFRSKNGVTRIVTYIAGGLGFEFLAFENCD